MPPPLSLSSMVRTPSLNRRVRGEASFTTSCGESLQTPGNWSNFAYYTGERSTLPCAKRALIVGIEYLDGQTFGDGRDMHLPGCHADVDDVLRLLREDGGYAARDIRILADVPGLPDNQRPTRENIIDGLHWLSDGCRSGERRFFHYAGHGTQVEDKDGDEEDGYDEAIQPADWATKYQRGDEGLIIDDEFRDFLVDPLPLDSTLTALVDVNFVFKSLTVTYHVCPLKCCHSGTILDMEQETKAVAGRSRTLGPMPRGSLLSTPSPSIILKLKFCRSSAGSVLPVGNILELPELAQVKDLDEPVTPGAERGPIIASDSVVLERRNVESPVIRRRAYSPIVANVVCWSACLDSQLAWGKPDEQINEYRGVLTSAFTRGFRGAAANYNSMPGAFDPEHRAATYAELFDYIREQERLAYEERLAWEERRTEAETALLYQDPQLWISASMGDIMDRPVIL